MRPLARDAAANNPRIRRAITITAAQVIGTGFVAKSKHPTAAVAQSLTEAWAAFEADMEGGNLASFLTLAYAAWKIDGECFVWLRTDADGALRPVLLPAEMVDSGLTQPLANGRRILGGIELDAEGRRLAYHVWKRHPGDPTGTSLERIRVPAEDMLHLFTPLEPGQQRGVSALAPILTTAIELDGMEDAQLVAARIGALFGGFIRDPDGQLVKAIAGDTPGPIADTSLEPGTFPVLPPGAEVEVVTPPIFAGAETFVRTHLRTIAAALGLPYEMLSGDLSGTNYSSIRAGLLDARRLWEAEQYNVLIPVILRPLWRRWVTLRALADEAEMAGFLAKPDPFYAVDFIPPAWPWVDPQKDIQAEALAVANGFKSRRQVVAERGYDAAEVDVEIAADQARAEGLGLSFGTQGAPGTATPETADARAE